MSILRVTRKDVAICAGVSETTVSFVLSGKRYVSEDLVRKVNNAVKQLGYYPDRAAKIMKSERSNLIAVLISDLTNPLYMQIIESIENHAMKNGYFVNICGGREYLGRYVSEFISRRVDGVFIAANAETMQYEYIEELLKHNITVVFGTVNDEMDKRICGVGIDFIYGMEQIICYLKELGHTDIAYLSQMSDLEVDERTIGFYKAMERHFGNKNPIVKNGTSEAKVTVHSGYVLTKELLKERRDFTALVCLNDLMAFGAMNAIRDEGLRVPEDISVVGIDDINFAEEWSTRLTTLSHKTEHFGECVFEVMRENIENKENVGRKIIQPELVIRKSTAKKKMG